LLSVAFFVILGVIMLSVAFFVILSVIMLSDVVTLGRGMQRRKMVSFSVSFSHSECHFNILNIISSF
jgi:hypothetical protein